MRIKSMKRNMIINCIRVLLNKIFPLITFPYVTRVLLENGVGRYNFAVAFVSYFQLIASLGIGTYAIREGAKKRDNKEAFDSFANEILMINFVSTVVSYMLLLIVLCNDHFDSYKTLILIYSATIFFDTIGVGWLYSVFEEFGYITIRSFVFQCLSVFLLFILVKSPKDVYIYMFITVLASGGSSVYNLFHSRKYVTLFSIKKIKCISCHLKPIFIIFAANIATVIYLNMDILMLGVYVDENCVGLYSAAVKLNAVTGSFITAISGVMTPRLSYYIKNGDTSKFDDLIIKVMKYFLFALVPTIVGLTLLSYDVVEIICGSSFRQSGYTFRIMLIDLFFATMNGFIAYQICIPNDKEKNVLVSTTCGAISNLLLNAMLIPLYHQNGAAVATVLSELIVFLNLIISTKKMVSYKKVFCDLWQIILAAIAFLPIYFILKKVIVKQVLLTILVITIGGIVYMFILKFLKNYIFNEICNESKKMLIKIKKQKSVHNL